MPNCVSWCPEPSMCREAGGCYAEAEAMHAAEQDAAYAAAMEREYAEAMAEMERDHYRAEHGGCGAHALHDLTCSDCLLAFRSVGLL